MTNPEFTLTIEPVFNSFCQKIYVIYLLFLTMASSPGNIFIVCSILLILLASFFANNSSTPSEQNSSIIENQQSTIQQLKEEVNRLQLQLAAHIAEEQSFLSEQKVQRDGLAEKDNRLEERIKKVDSMLSGHTELDNKRHQNEAMSRAEFLEEIREGQKIVGVLGSEVKDVRKSVIGVENSIEDLKNNEKTFEMKNALRINEIQEIQENRRTVAERVPKMTPTSQPLTPDYHETMKTQEHLESVTQPDQLQEKIQVQKQDQLNTISTGSTGPTPLHPVPSCPMKTFGTKFPITPIHSFMGAGNTWLRYLIERTTGFYTGSAFSDSALIRGGFKGERLRPEQFNQTIGVKVHNTGDSSGERQTYHLVKTHKVSKCVILLRNPYKTFIAEWNRFTTKNHVGSSDVDEQAFASSFARSKEAIEC